MPAAVVGAGLQHQGVRRTGPCSGTLLEQVDGFVRDLSAVHRGAAPPHHLLPAPFLTHPTAHRLMLPPFLLEGLTPASPRWPPSMVSDVVVSPLLGTSVTALIPSEWDCACAQICFLHILGTSGQMDPPAQGWT